MSSAFSARELRLRAFGTEVEDLDVDFSSPSRPAAVTEVLRACARDARGLAPSDEQLLALDVGARVEALLEVARKGGLDLLTVEVTCTRPSCLERVEVGCSIDGLIELNRSASASASCVVELERETVELRRPTGADQLAWSSRASAQERWDEEAIVRSLELAGGPDSWSASLPEDVLEAIGEAMRDFDPLVSLQVEVACPTCGLPEVYDVDVQEEALRALERRQEGLVRDVHRLASVYHWGERDIVSIPESRRRRYLAHLTEETVP